MDDDEVKKHWKNMPEFEQNSKAAFARVMLNFETQEDMDAFNKITGLSVTQKTKGVFYPPKKTPKVRYDEH